MSGEFKVANKVGEIIFLRGDVLAVTFPWKGVLLKSTIDNSLIGEVIEHEKCHIAQIEKYGSFNFIIEYNKTPEKFEDECYGRY